MNFVNDFDPRLMVKRRNVRVMDPSFRSFSSAGYHSVLTCTVELFVRRNRTDLACYRSDRFISLFSIRFHNPY